VNVYFKIHIHLREGEEITYKEGQEMAKHLMATHRLPLKSVPSGNTEDGVHVESHTTEVEGDDDKAMKIALEIATTIRDHLGKLIKVTPVIVTERFIGYADIGPGE